jgi:hypothetical protein
MIPINQWELRARAEILRDNFLEARPSGFTSELLNKLELPFMEA